MVKWDIFRKLNANALISTVLFFLAECQRAVIDVAIYISGVHVMLSPKKKKKTSVPVMHVMDSLVTSLSMLILVVTYYRFKMKKLKECHILVLQLIFLLLFNNSIVGRYKIWTTTIYNTLNI